MKVRFQKEFYKHWFFFPICFVWETNIVEYIVPAQRFEIHFLWWHFRWTFTKGGE